VKSGDKRTTSWNVHGPKLTNGETNIGTDCWRNLVKNKRLSLLLVNPWQSRIRNRRMWRGERREPRLIQGCWNECKRSKRSKRLPPNDSDKKSEKGNKGIGNKRRQGSDRKKSDCKGKGLRAPKSVLAAARAFWGTALKSLGTGIVPPRARGLELTVHSKNEKIVPDK
jgi:hypothetical protein